MYINVRLIVVEFKPKPFYIFILAMDTSNYNEESQLASLQAAVNSAPENPINYLKLLDYLKKSDSSEVSEYFLFCQYN